MEAWFFFVVSLCVAIFLKSLYDFFFPKLKLPPAPIRLPLLGNLLSIPTSFSRLEPIVRKLHAKYGRIFTLHFGSQPAIFMSTNSLAYQTLVQNGAIFADRPAAMLTKNILSRNQTSISFTPYGPTWRLLRRNLTSEILFPSRIKSYAHARKWVLEILISRLGCNSVPVHVLEHFQFAMLSLLALMCFGDKLEEGQIQEIERVHTQILLGFPRFKILEFLPRVGKKLFRKRWEEFQRLYMDLEDTTTPLIRARQQLKQRIESEPKQDNNESLDYVLSYVDTLLDLQLPEENRKLDEGEMITLCSEFLIAGTGGTSVALQWIMANLVKYPHIQAELFKDINGVMEQKQGVVKEEDLQNLPYLRAVVLETLRYHSPGNFLLPHAVTQEVVLDGYVIPTNAIVNFMTADMGRNPEVWKDPMKFKPERFLTGEAFDITGSKEIKMMPFGAGRRMCPGYGLAMLHLEYFVANLVWKFEWKAVDGDDVDLSEKHLEFLSVMKNPLQALISPRLK